MKIGYLNVALFLSMSLLVPVKAEAETANRVILSYIDTGSLLCEAGSEVAFTATLLNVQVNLANIVAINHKESECFITNRRGVEKSHRIIPCGENNTQVKPENRGVSAKMNGVINACQRGFGIRLLDSEIALSLIEMPGTPNISVSLGAGKYSDRNDNDTVAFLKFLMRGWSFPRNKVISDDGRVRYVNKERIIDDVAIQDDILLPTDEIYGIKVSTRIEVVFGATENITNGETQ